MEAGTFSIVPIDILKDRRLTFWQTKVLIALFSFRNKTTNTVYPSREVIAQRSGMHINNVSKTTSELEELGWLSKSGKGGFSKATRYELKVPNFLSKDLPAEQTTLAESTTLPLADSTIFTLADSTRGKEHTKEETKEHILSAQTESFETFWSVYPKKESKKKAFESWCKIKDPEKTLQDIFNALEWQKIQPKWTERDGQFIPMAVTYLNQERWLDEKPSTIGMSTDIRDW
jgi:hypothetical protein